MVLAGGKIHRKMASEKTSGGVAIGEVHASSPLFMLIFHHPFHLIYKMYIIIQIHAYLI